MTLLNTASAVRLGSAQASAAYVGATQVWPPVPRRLPGLAVWLDASQLGLADGANVSTLPNLAPGGAQGSMQTGVPMPKMKAADTPGGLPCVRFSTSEAGFRMTGTGVTTSGTLSYVARMLQTSNSPGRVVGSIYPGDSNWVLGYHTNYYDWFYDNGPGNTGKSWDANGYLWKQYTGDWDATTGDHLWEHGNPLGAFGFGTGPADALTISGYNPTAGQETCDCEFCEIVVYNRVLTDPERQQIEGYLTNKWLPPAPKTVPGLLFWLDASQLPGAVDSLISTWPDLSGKGHDCIAISPTDQPARRLSPNGLSWAAFSGSNGSGMTIAGLGAELSGRSAFSAVYMVYPLAFSGYPILMCAPTNAAWNWILEDDSTGIYVGVTGGHYRMMTMPVGPLTGAWNLVSVTADPSNTRLWMNGSEITSYNLGPNGDNHWPIPSLGTDALLGTYFDGNYCWNGQVAEFALYDHVLTDVERQKLESYLRTKWS
jgi:hypothetical protein